MTITIRVTDEVWKQLNDLRKNTKETFNDVLVRLLSTANSFLLKKHSSEIKSSRISNGGASESKDPRKLREVGSK